MSPIYRSEKLRLVAWGELGLFTQPAFRADRVTYPVMPPTAAMGIVKAIAWEPEADLRKGEPNRLEVEISAIHVLNPIRHFRMRVNEIEELPKGTAPYQVTPKQTSLVLVKDPKYLIEFTYVSTRELGGPVLPKKFAEIFKRRLSKGQVFRQPCFGRRRYVAYVREATEADQAVSIYQDLGHFPWHIEYHLEKDRQHMELHTFEAKLEDGVLRVPSYYDACLSRGEEVRL